MTRNRKIIMALRRAELDGETETAHLLRSPRNAQRLLAAYRRAGKGQRKPETLEKLRREMRLEPAR